MGLGRLLNSKGLKKFGLLFLVVLILALGFKLVKGEPQQQADSAQKPEPTMAKPLSVKADELVLAESKKLIQTLDVSGSLQAEKRAEIRVMASGKLLQLLVKEGDAVKKGQLLAVIDPVESQAHDTQQTSALDQANAQLATAKRNYDNDKALFEKGFIAKNTFKNSEDQLQVAQAGVDSARAALQIGKKGVSDTRVVSPIDGEISEKLFQQGEEIRAQDKLFSVVDIRRIEIVLQIPVEQSVGVKSGLPVLLFFDHLPEPVLSKLNRVTPAATEVNRAITAYVTLDNQDIRYRPGMFVSGILSLRQQADVLLLPSAAIREQLGEKLVYVVNNQQQIEMRKVKLGRSGFVDFAANQTIWFEILEGIAAGEKVIVKDLGALTTGRAVRIE